MTPEGAGSSAGSRSNRSILLRVAGVALVGFLAIAAVQLIPHAGNQTRASSSTASSASSSLSLTQTSSATLKATSSATRPSPPTLCSAPTPLQQAVNSQVLSSDRSRAPYYDEQLWLGFQQNFTSSLSYNVTVLAQNDSFGYGPVYLLNGLSDKGYWYQTGVAWNFPTGVGSLFNAGFRFVYEVWDTSTRASVYPLVGATVPQRFNANDGDKVLLSLTVAGGQIAMQAADWNTGAQARASFNSYGAAQFLGFKDAVSPFPSSLLTEWYHVLPYFCTERPVAYSNTLVSMATAWMHIDEWNLTGVPLQQRFNSSDSRQCCILETGYQGFGFNDPAALQSLSANGTTVYADANEFLTM